MNKPPLRCWKCDYDLTGLDPERECPECGSPINPGLHPGENRLFGVAAMLCGVLSIPVGLSVVFIWGLGWWGPVLTGLGSLTLAVLAFVLGRHAEPRWARKLNIRPEYSIADLGMLFALFTFVGLALIWIPTLLSLVL